MEVRLLTRRAGTRARHRLTLRDNLALLHKHGAEERVGRAEAAVVIYRDEQASADRADERDRSGCSGDHRGADRRSEVDAAVAGRVRGRRLFEVPGDRAVDGLDEIENSGPRRRREDERRNGEEQQPTTHRVTLR